MYVCDNERETCSPAVVAAMPTSASSLPTAICPSDSGMYNIDKQEIWMTTERVCVCICVCERVRVYVCMCAYVAATPTSASSLPSATSTLDSGTHNMGKQEICRTAERVCVCASLVAAKKEAPTKNMSQENGKDGKSSNSSTSPGLTSLKNHALLFMPQTMSNIRTPTHPTHHTHSQSFSEPDR